MSPGFSNRPSTFHSAPIPVEFFVEISFDQNFGVSLPERSVEAGRKFGAVTQHGHGVSQLMMPECAFNRAHPAVHHVRRGNYVCSFWKSNRYSVKLAWCIKFQFTGWERMRTCAHYEYKAKRLSWNSGKPHGQNAHRIENHKQNLSPLTHHGNAPVSTQGPFQLRSCAFLD